MAYLTCTVFFFYRNHTNVDDDGDEFNEISSGLMNEESQIYNLSIQNKEKNAESEILNTIGNESKKAKKNVNSFQKKSADKEDDVEKI